MAKHKKRKVGDTYRPTVAVLKEIDGLPTRIEINGTQYHAAYHEQYQSSKIKNAKARRADKRKALQQKRSGEDAISKVI